MFTVTRDDPAGVAVSASYFISLCSASEVMRHSTTW